MSDYPYEEFILITARLDSADREIKKLKQELEAMWEHVKRPTQQEMNKEVNAKFNFFSKLIP